MPRTPLDLKDGPTKYVDRPTNDGKHGDGADEPTEAAPESSTPGRPHDTSRQQKHGGQKLQSGSESLDKHSAEGGDPRPEAPASAK